MNILAYFKNSLDNLNMAKTKKEKVTKTEYEVELSETTGTVVPDLQNPAFDPDIPEQKQRNFR